MKFAVDAMEAERLCQYLEDLLQSQGVTVRYEDLRSQDHVAMGAACRIKGDPYLFIDKSASAAEKIKLLAQELRSMDLEGIYIKPAIRELLGISGLEQRRGGGDKRRKMDDPGRS
jgi:hypothetical protein